ncbi:MAG: glycerophosphodiester phosphodiesterase [Anaerolineales bacterium]
MKKLKRRRRRGRGCLSVLVTFILVYYGTYFLFRGSRTAAPQLIAHRGGPAQAPENTLAAFRKAIDVGADWLEMDVQVTGDGELIVFHDETVERTTNGTGRVGELTLEQIRALDAGGGERVPTFAEVIALAKEAGVSIMPEAKSPHLYPGIEEKMVQAIVEAGYLGRTVIQSFNPKTLETFKSINPDVQVCPLYGLWKLRLPAVPPGRAEIVCPMAEMVVLNPWMIRAAHARGQQVYVWFGAIEHPLTLRLILAFGADGLMVDDPVAMAKVLGR